MSTTSHKPIVWGLFAAGGTIAAFFAPVLMLVTGFMPFAIGDVLSYDRVHAFADNWIGKLIIFGLIFLMIWHAAHRLRITAHDFGIRADLIVAFACYAAAGAVYAVCRHLPDFDLIWKVKHLG